MSNPRELREALARKLLADHARDYPAGLCGDDIVGIDVEYDDGFATLEEQEDTAPAINVTVRFHQRVCQHRVRVLDKREVSWLLQRMFAGALGLPGTD